MEICDKYRLNLLSENYTKFDRVLEKACYKFCNPNSGRIREADLKHYIVEWWTDHKQFMEKYTNQAKLSELMNLTNRSTLAHYLRRRVKSKNYDKNVKVLKDWMFDVTDRYRIY